MEYRKAAEFAFKTYISLPFLILLLLPLQQLLPSPNTQLWSPCNSHRYKKITSIAVWGRTHPSNPELSRLTEAHEDTLRGECFTFNQLDGVYPDECFVHLSVSFSGDITELVSAEMLAGALVVGTILTALPGKRQTQKYIRNYNFLSSWGLKLHWIWS